MNRNILLTIEYDGTGFHGWQRQPGLRTAQGVLEEGLSRITGQQIQVDGTSRTDAGVHALGQRATFQGDFGIPTDRIPIAANHIMGGDIRITEAVDVPDGFHARFSSRGKKYRYVIWNSSEMPVFYRNYRYQVEKPLDIGRMRRAAEDIVGTHDFQCFQAAGGTPRETTVRTIYDLQLLEEVQGRQIALEISGDGFLYNMVRIITGTLVDIGLGKMPVDAAANAIQAGDRRLAGHTAPPQGLYLMEVYY